MSGRGLTRRIVAIACACAVALGTCAVTAQADETDDLNARKDTLAVSSSQAQAEVDQSNASLIAAQDSVKQAKATVAQAVSDLSVAEDLLDQAEAALVDAQAEEAIKAEELRKADQALESALAREARGQAKVDAQKSAVNAYARSIVQDSMPLVNVAALINVSSTASLSNRIQWSDTVLGSNQVDLDHLRDLQEELAEARSASQVAQQQADAAREEAQAKVDATASARLAAEDARDAHQVALDEKEAALAAQVQAEADALAALQEDQAQLAAIEAERASVDARLQEIYAAAEAARIAQEQADAAAAAAAAAGSAVSSSGLMWPVSGPITSYYGWRSHPIWGDYRFHDGLDIGVGCGVPVRAAAGGVVTDAYFSSGYGYRMFIDHGWINGNHMVTAYNHMSGYAVSAGTWVAQGDTVGYVGTTGASTGCHMHLMLWVNGSMDNVLNYLP